MPHTRYYGTWDATPLYLIALAEAWRWHGNRELIEDVRETAERCLAWIDQFCDLDGDGFQEYQTYSPKGYPNMNWKDAEDAVVYPDGSQAPQPKALCELQGYVYAAKRGMAEVFAGLERQAESFPVQYVGANMPQAWAAGSVFQALQMMLGLDADVPNGHLWVNPTLPDWIPSLDLTGLKPGQTALDLRFWHDTSTSRFDVVAQHRGQVDVKAGRRPAWVADAADPTSDQRQGIITDEHS